MATFQHEDLDSTAGSYTARGVHPYVVNFRCGQGDLVAQAGPGQHRSSSYKPHTKIMGINTLRFRAKAMYKGHGRHTDVEGMEALERPCTRAMGDKQTLWT